MLLVLIESDTIWVFQSKSENSMKSENLAEVAKILFFWLVENDWGLELP